jgi:hypothetical protein
MKPKRLPSPLEVMDEPERAILAALDATLEITEIAVLAAHPELYADEPPAGACEDLLAADRLIGLIREMQGTIASYHRWLKEMPAKPDQEDPPF